MGQTFDVLAEAEILPAELALRLKKAVGFRNIVIHNYTSVDWEIVHTLCIGRLEDFAEFARYVLNRLDAGI
jgi:uncharacterized protein YutE (UPF0331/DUF86 family)